MDSSFFLTIVAAAAMLLATIFFLFFRKFRFHKANKTIASSLSPLSSFPHPWKHHVFPNFHGADVRKAFLSHILKEFRSKGIDLFIDNDIERSKSIGPELIEAIRGSRVSIIFLSKNYASSTWCMNELVEIIKCREEFGQTVITVFYEVDPTDVKKQTGEFGKVFRKNCNGKTKEDIGRWRQALAEAAKIAGYHSSNWDDEAAMIEKIATDISNKLNIATPSGDFDGLIGMGAHMERMEWLLRLDLEEGRMIGIWGPPGIGCYPRPCLDECSAQLQLQNQMLSQMINQRDIMIPHLGVAQERLKDKKVLVVLDDVDRLGQLDALAKEIWWFSPGSRIIITTEDLRVLKAHKINHIYKVRYPSTDEALQIFCTYAFGQKHPYNGFYELAQEVTYLAGSLPLGLKVMGSYFRGMSKQEWTKAFPRLRTRLDGEIESILKFSYDALCDEYKDLFLHICCLFNLTEIEKVEEHLERSFLDVAQGLHVLAEKSLISIDSGYINIHTLLLQLGREIVRKQFLHGPGKRQILVNARDICEVLNDDTTGSRSVIGITLHLSDIKDKFNISERAFEGMSNLQFLRFSYDKYDYYNMCFLRGQNYQFLKLRLLDWRDFPMTCLPSCFNTEFLIELNMSGSKLEKLWEGIQPLRNLKWMNLMYSKNLKELPDLSTATNLRELDLCECSRLVKLPYSIGKAINLENLDLHGCASLVKLPLSIGNVHNLKRLELTHCSNLVELHSSIGNATNIQHLELIGCSSLVGLPSSIGNLHQLSGLRLGGCSKLEVLPTNINMESLNSLFLDDCSLIKSFPEISTNIEYLSLVGTSIEEVPSSIRSWSRLNELHMSYSENLKEFPHALDTITVLVLSDTEIKEVAPWVKGFSRLRQLVLSGCGKLISLPQLPDSLSILDADDCESLERLDCSFHNPELRLKFVNCFKLNQEARDHIIQTSTRKVAVLPGAEVPAYFTYRASGSSLTVKLNQKPDCPSTKFKTCILLVNEGEFEAGDWELMNVDCSITSKQNSLTACRSNTYNPLSPMITEHLYTFDAEAEEVTSTDLVFEFKLRTLTQTDSWKIKECGILPIDEHYERFRDGDEDYES